MAQYVYTMNRVGKIVPPKRQILKDISLSFFPGAKIGVLGLNGSGKSSLLRIMAGVDKEYEGEAVPMPGLKVGFLPQEPQLDADKTVRESVEEGMSEVLGAQKRLDEVYAAYAEDGAQVRLVVDGADVVPPAGVAAERVAGIPRDTLEGLTPRTADAVTVVAARSVLGSADALRAAAKADRVLLAVHHDDRGRDAVAAAEALRSGGAQLRGVVVV